MNFYIKGYKSQPRLAKVVTNAGTDYVNKKGIMTILSDKVVLGIDGYTLPISAVSFLDKLQNGDIVSIDELGRGYKLFSAEENDATVFVTGHCNSNCIMCPCSDYERKFSNGLDDDSMLEYLDLLPDDLGHIVVTGGEPTLRLDMFMRVMEYISKRFSDVETLLLSNGRSFSFSKLVDYLKCNSPKNIRVAVPVHGHVAELHDMITQAKGSFMQTDLGIRNLLSRQVPVELRVVITKQNYCFLKEISENIIKNYNTVTVVNFVGLETRGSCAANFDKVYVDHNIAFNSLKLAAEILIEHGIDVGIYNFPLCSVDKGFWELCKKSITPEKVRYLAECQECEAKSYCGGFFNTTMAKVKPQVTPIRSK